MDGLMYSQPSMVVGSDDGLGSCKPKQPGDMWRRLTKQAKRASGKDSLFFTFHRVEIPSIRVVLTRGVAGVGKTFAVYKYIHDCAEGSANDHINLMIPFSFRELNAVKHRRFSLLGLIHEFHPTLRWVREDDLTRRGVCAMIIFDGLDQSKIPMDFDEHDYVNDVTVPASVSVLLTNLITANLYPQAQLWITTRPAAARQIPREYVDRVTEVRGFVGIQRDEFFLKRFNDKDLAQRFIEHMKASKRLSAMCHIPLFCSVVASVVETNEKGRMPDTLTDVLFSFLAMQDQQRKDLLALERKLQEIEESGVKELEQSVQQELIQAEAKVRRQQHFRETNVGLAGISAQSGPYWHQVLPKINDRARSHCR